MDFEKFDVRGKAEEGQAFPILHPERLEPLVEDGKEARFIVRGSSSPSVQAANREALKKALETASDDSTAHDFEWLHHRQIDSAMNLLTGFENTELRGVPVTMENAREFLNLVFPRVVRGSDGAFKVANKTFAMQVIERSQELDELLGNV